MIEYVKLNQPYGTYANGAVLVVGEVVYGTDRSISYYNVPHGKGDRMCIPAHLADPCDHNGNLILDPVQVELDADRHEREFGLPPVTNTGDVLTDEEIQEGWPAHSFETDSRRPGPNPKDLVGIKKAPLHLIPAVAKVAMAGAFADGANKYGAYNWRSHPVLASIYRAAAERHLDAFFDGEDMDPVSKVAHLGHAMACCAIMLDAASCGNLIDDRPVPGRAGEVQRAYNGPTPGGNT